jgi:hypothetical protein
VTVDRARRDLLNETQSVVENRRHPELTREVHEAAAISGTSEIDLSRSQKFDDINNPSDLNRSSPLACTPGCGLGM